jgi:hypothetical protein
MHLESPRNVVRPLAALAAAVLLTGSSLSAVVAREDVYDPDNVEIVRTDSLPLVAPGEYAEHSANYSAIQLPAVVFDHEEHTVSFEAINSVNAPIGSSLADYVAIQMSEIVTRPLDHEEHNVAFEAINSLNALPEAEDDEE